MRKPSCKLKKEIKTASTYSNKKVIPLERLFFSNILKFKGFQLRVAGKLNGKMRKSKYHYKLGKTEFQVLNIYVAYSFFISYTKFGVLSLKI